MLANIQRFVCICFLGCVVVLTRLQLKCVKNPGSDKCTRCIARNTECQVTLVSRKKREKKTWVGLCCALLLTNAFAVITSLQLKTA